MNCTTLIGREIIIRAGLPYALYCFTTRLIFSTANKIIYEQYWFYDKKIDWCLARLKKVALRSEMIERNRVDMFDVCSSSSKKGTAASTGYIIAGWLAAHQSFSIFKASSLASIFVFGNLLFLGPLERTNEGPISSSSRYLLLISSNRESPVSHDG